MKTSSVILGFTAALFAGACEQAADQKTEPRSSSEAMVVIEGVNAAALKSALFSMGDLQILADGRALPVSIDSASADLARSGEQLSLRFSVPGDARQLDVRIGFDDFGGYDAKGGRAGEIDARGKQIRFELPAHALAQSRQAVVRLDLDRSLFEARPDRLVLLPNFELRY
jgi:hypothetical protein